MYFKTYLSHSTQRHLFIGMLFFVFFIQLAINIDGVYNTGDLNYLQNNNAVPVYSVLEDLDMDEENDNFTLASAIVKGNDVMGVIFDIDIFSIQLNSGENIYAVIDFGENAPTSDNVSISITRSDGFTIVSTLDCGSQRWLLTVNNVPATETYYLIFAPGSQFDLNVFNESFHFSYYFAINNVVDDSYEENDDSSSKYSVEEKSYSGINIIDPDWFYVYLQPSYHLVIEILCEDYTIPDFALISDDGITILNDTVSIVDSNNGFQYITLSYTSESNQYCLIRLLPTNGMSFNAQIKVKIYGNPISTPNVDLYEDYSVVNHFGMTWSYRSNMQFVYIFRSLTSMSPPTVPTFEPYRILVGEIYNTYWDEWLTESATYYYAIVYSDGIVNSSLSNQVEKLVVVNFTQKPILSFLGSAPVTDGNVHLYLNLVDYADMYYLYRELDPIMSTTGLIPIEIIPNSIVDWYDIVGPNGTYYYAVFPSCPARNGTLSDYIQVNVANSPPSAPILEPFNASITDHRWIKVKWSEVAVAQNYSLYHSMSPIISTTGLTPISTKNQRFEYIELTSIGTHYYAVIVNSIFGSSSLSNCEAVTYIGNEPTNYTMTYISNDINYWVDPSEGGYNPEINSSTLLSQYHLPFNFTFYGTNFSKVWIGQSGMLSFMELNDYYITPRTIPSENPDNAYLMHAFDFESELIGLGDMKVCVRAYSDKIVFQWIAMGNSYFPSSTVQIILFTNNSVLFNYYLNRYYWNRQVGINYGDGDYYGTCQTNATRFSLIWNPLIQDKLINTTTNTTNTTTSSSIGTEFGTSNSSNSTSNSTPNTISNQSTSNSTNNDIPNGFFSIIGFPIQYFIIPLIGMVIFLPYLSKRRINKIN